MTDSIQLSLKFDQPQLPSEYDAVRYLLARLDPPEADPDRMPPPLDLAIVIDASGSMTGLPLEAAKEATLRLVRELPDTTRLTIVSFAEDVVVHVDAMSLDKANQTEIFSRVAGLQTRGQTNLFAGWQTGCAVLTPAESLAQGRRCHVVVLSDGHANSGVVDRERFAMQAAKELERGISTSCVGVGDGYSPEQLSALAEQGGGECHDAENANEIVEVLMGEVLSLNEVVAESVQLAIDVPAGVRARELSGMPGAFDGHRLLVPVGAVRAGVPRVVVIRLEIPAGLTVPDGSGGLTIAGEVDWREPGLAERRAGSQVRVRAIRSEGVASSGQLRVPTLEDARLVLTAWQAYLVRFVTERNRDGDYAGIDRMWQVEFDAFSLYAAQHYETQAFVTTIERIRARASRPMPERRRKQARDMAGKMARQARALYRAPKGSVLEQFSEDLDCLGS